MRKKLSDGFPPFKHLASMFVAESFRATDMPNANPKKNQGIGKTDALQLVLTGEQLLQNAASSGGLALPSTFLPGHQLRGRNS